MSTLAQMVCKFSQPLPSALSGSSPLTLPLPNEPHSHPRSVVPAPDILPSLSTESMNPTEL